MNSRPRRSGALPLLLLALVGAGLLAALLWLALTPVKVPETAPRLVAEAAAAPKARAERPDESDDAPAADTTAPPSRPPVLAARALEGTVTTPDEQPLGGVAVKLVLAAGNGRERAQERLARTDTQGHYRIDDSLGRVERLVFTAPGYEERRFESPSIPLTPVARWDATLESQGGVHGLVLSPEGPVSNAVLGLWVGDSRGVSTVAQSDANGRFALALPEAAGPYTLKARHPAHGEASQPVSGPGELVVRLPGGGYLVGHVVDTAEDPIQAFAVSAEPQMRRMMAMPVAQSFDTSDGAFRLGPVAAGTYAVRAAAEGFQPGEPVEVEVQAGGETRDIVLVMKASGTLEGRVTDARTRAPIEGALVVPAEWSNGDLAESVGALTDTQGRYRLEALPGKRSSLNVSAEGYRTLLGGGVVVAPGKTVRRDFALTPQVQGQRPTSELTGIGAVLAPRPDGVAISSIVEGGPAARALSEGDVVVSVDGRPVAGLPLSDVANAIRGELGTEVTLFVRRGGEGDPERVVLRRDRVSMPERGHGGGNPHKNPHATPND